MGYFASYTRPRLDLGAAFWEYLDTPGLYAGTQVLVPRRVPLKTANFPVISRESLLRDADLARAAGDHYNRDDFDAEEQNYTCAEYGQEQQIDDGVRSLYANDFDAELAATRAATMRLLREQDKRIAAALFNTSTWTGSPLYTDNSASPWATVSTDIIGQVLAASEKVRQNTGMKPNYVLMSRNNLIACAQNTAIRSAVQYTGIPTFAALTDALRGLFDVDEVIVGGGVRNTVAEGGTFTAANVWSALYVQVGRKATSESIEEPCVGRTFLWDADAPDNVNVEIYREEQTRSDIVRVRQFCHEKVIDPYFAHLMKVG